MIFVTELTVSQSSKIRYRRVVPFMFKEYRILVENVNRDNVFGKATRYGLDGLGFEHRWGRNFPHLSRPGLRRAQPAVK
jgi:hypothetical protein